MSAIPVARWRNRLASRRAARRTLYPYRRAARRGPAPVRPGSRGGRPARCRGSSSSPRLQLSGR